MCLYPLLGRHFDSKIVFIFCHNIYIKQWEILLRHQAKEIDCNIKAVISNHPNLQPIVETFGIPFYCFPITPDSKQDQEKKQIELLKNELDVDVIVLARYMQVLSRTFLEAFTHDQIINIHHSFLPAFIGSSPYHQVRIDYCSMKIILFLNH